MTDLRIGIDFGGTKIEIAALDGEGGFALRHRVPNPGSYEAAIETVRTLIADAERQLGQKATIGIGTPGSLNPRTGLMRNANSTWLNGRAFQTDLESALDREIRMANDANCLALSEARDGAAAGKRIVFAVIIGTGCGGGVAIDGKLIDGANGIAGEFGHIALPWPTAEEFPGPTCWCGLPGCLETWISGSGFQRDYEARTGQVMGAPDIVAAAKGGDAPARAALTAYVDRLARGLATIANVIDPDCFVLGGGMSNVDSLYAELPARIRHYAFSDMWDSAVVPAHWGDSSGVRGAAHLWE
jgi:fructokinase